MITPMTRYSFILVNGEQEGFLSSLQQLGLVDITRSIKPVDEGTRERLMALMEPFTEKYLIFRSGATDSLTALNNLKPYIVPGSDIDKRAQNALDGLSWAHASSFKMVDYEFRGILPLANNYYVCNVTATTQTYTYGKGEVTDVMDLSVICYDNGDMTLAFQVN